MCRVALEAEPGHALWSCSYTDPPAKLPSYTGEKDSLPFISLGEPCIYFSYVQVLQFGPMEIHGSAEASISLPSFFLGLCRTSDIPNYLTSSTIVPGLERTTSWISLVLLTPLCQYIPQCTLICWLLFFTNPSSSQPQSAPLPGKTRFGESDNAVLIMFSLSVLKGHVVFPVLVYSTNIRQSTKALILYRFLLTH